METQIENKLELRSLSFEDVTLTGITEFGASWKDLVSGKLPLPPEGARFDVAFEGTISGPFINGTKRGVDYLEVRADGKFMLNLHAVITTSDGENISVQETGVLTPSQDGSAIGKLRLNMRMISHAPKYNWLNKIEVLGDGYVDMLNGKIIVTAFMPEVEQ